jgi:mono/diheme cytochrome c family protein
VFDPIVFVNPMPLFPKISAQRIAVLMLGILLVFSSGLMGMAKAPQTNAAYVQQVLHRSGDAAQGEAIFQMNCAVCHGATGNGNVGPSLRAVSHRKSREGLIIQVISGKTPPMPQFQPSEQTMADLLSYLGGL